MTRRTFADVLKNAEITLNSEYRKLHYMFYRDSRDDYRSLRSLCSQYFLKYHFRGTCLSLDEFEALTDYSSFYNKTDSIDLDSFISFCEYTINLLSPLRCFGLHDRDEEINIYFQNVFLIMEKIGYMQTQNNELMVTIFVPKSPEAIAVSEIIDPALSYKTIEYNHHSMKGNLDKKRETLRIYADLLEAQRKNLKAINSSLEQDVFSLFNNINIRHNNADSQSPNFHKYIADMSDEELEDWYDETYQLCLLCFLELDNVERKKKIKELNENIKNSDKPNQ